jgi:hypothetical protein
LAYARCGVGLTKDAGGTSFSDAFIARLNTSIGTLEFGTEEVFGASGFT